MDCITFVVGIRLKKNTVKFCHAHSIEFKSIGDIYEICSVLCIFLGSTKIFILTVGRNCSNTDQQNDD